MMLLQMVMTFGISAITIAAIFLVRRFKLSAAWRYNLWYLLLAALTLPFLPKGWIPFENQADIGGRSFSTINLSGSYQVNSGMDSNWMQDFGTSVNQFNYAQLNTVFFVIWVVGIFTFSFFLLHSHLQLNRLSATASKVRGTEILSLFEECKNDLGIRKRIALLESSDVSSPMTFGFFRTTILLPKEMDVHLSLNEIKYLLLHELQHDKSLHTKANYIFLFYQILYWFNPLVWIALREMRMDRELACDDAVLHSLAPVNYKEYGHTILHFIERKQQLGFSTLTNQLSGSKKQIKRRIIHIASFQKDTRSRIIKSISLYAVIAILVLTQFSFYTVTSAEEDHIDVKDRQVLYEDLSTYFTGVEGSFVLLSLKEDRYHIYNEEKSMLRVSPDSTYKIYSALIGLEEKVITPGDSAMKWNGKQNEYKEWNRDQTMDTAMKHSVNWYFQDLDRKIGEDTLATYLERLNYGNKDLSGGVGNYWLESSLKISPVEQVELLRTFYINEQHFNPVNVETVKSALTLEKNGDSMLYGKTGTGIINGETVNGWFIGFVETNDDTWFFATNIQDNDTANGSKAAKITLSILKDKELY
ncbi:MAG: BlaR1 family beta-lactam sensor/signal transducer [Bacillota bacterium]